MKIDEVKKDLRSMEAKKIQQKLLEKRSSFNTLQMKEMSKEKKNPAKLKKIKKEIAIISTIIREKIENNEKAGKKN